MAMCGPIVMNFAGKRDRLLAYQLGRGLGYVTAGAVAGGLGQKILGPAQPQWISNVAILLIITMLVINGWRVVLGKPLHYTLPTQLNIWMTSVWKWMRVSTLPKVFTAGLSGLFTVFLPCGHLYSFLLGAVATGSALKGFIFMLAFWLGSAPLLSFSGIWIQRFLKPKIANGQRWAGVLLVFAGVYSAATFGLRWYGSASTESGHHEMNQHEHFEHNQSGEVKNQQNPPSGSEHSHHSEHTKNSENMISNGKIGLSGTTDHAH